MNLFLSCAPSEILTFTQIIKMITTMKNTSFFENKSSVEFPPLTTLVLTTPIGIPRNNIKDV